MAISLSTVTPARNLALRAANLEFGIVVHPNSANANLYRDLSRLHLIETLNPLFDNTLQFRTTPLGAELAQDTHYLDCDPVMRRQVCIEAELEPLVALG